MVTVKGPSGVRICAEGSASISPSHFTLLLRGLLQLRLSHFAKEACAIGTRCLDDVCMTTCIPVKNVRQGVAAEHPLPKRHRYFQARHLDAAGHVAFVVFFEGCGGVRCYMLFTGVSLGCMTFIFTAGKRVGTQRDY